MNRMYKVGCDITARAVSPTTWGHAPGEAQLSTPTRLCSALKARKDVTWMTVFLLHSQGNGVAQTTTNTHATRPARARLIKRANLDIADDGNGRIVSDQIRTLRLFDLGSLMSIKQDCLCRVLGNGNCPIDTPLRLMHQI